MAESAEVLALPAEGGAAPLGPKPGEVWSFWDMLKFDGGALVSASNALRNLSTVVDGWQKDDQRRPVPKRDAEFFIEELNNARTHINVIGAQITCLAIDELIAALSRGSDEDRIYYEGVATALNTILSTLRRELSILSLFVLDRDKARLFESNASLFGAEVEKSYPSAAFEIEEAGKCLALSRPTAAVFHLMRVVEIGLKSASKCLGIPDPVKDSERNWGVVLKRIKDQMDARSKSGAASPLPPRDKQFFGEIYGSLDAVRVAWRNSTMHVENKYTDDEAEHIWIAVKGFMRKLASRCNEDGQPLA